MRFIIFLTVFLTVMTGTMHPGTGQVRQIALSSEGTYAASSVSVTTLSSLIEEALQNSPMIKEKTYYAEAALDRIAPAGAWMDPMIGIGIMNLPTNLNLSSEPMSAKQIMLMQNIPINGVTGLRTRIAREEYAIAGAMVEDAKLMVVRDVSVAYFEWFYLEKAIEITQKNQKILKNITEIARKKYEVGEGLQKDVLKSQLEESKLIDKFITLQTRRDMMVYEINQLLGRERGAPLGVPAEVEFIPYSVEPEQIYALAAERHPQFSAFRTTIRRNERSIDIARKMYYPELNVEIGYGQRNMMPDVLSAQLTLAIPIWKNRKQSREVEEMMAMKNASEQALHDYKTMVTMQIQSLTAMANEHSQRIKLLTEVIIPQAQQTLEAALAAYSVDKGDFQMILDDQIELLMFEVDYYMLLAEYHKSLSKLDYYTAKSLNAN